MNEKDLYDELHPQDRALLDKAEDVAAECHNFGDRLEGSSSLGASSLALCAGVVFAGGVVARGLRELTEAVRHAGAVARSEGCQCLCHVCQPAANDAGQAVPGAASELD